MGRIDDEFFHRPGEEEYWSESHYLDFVADGIRGHARIGYYPNRGTVDVWTYVVADGSIYWLADRAVSPTDAHGLVVRTGTWDVGLSPAEPENAWLFELDGTVTRSASPGDVLAGQGASVPMELSFRSVPRHEPFYYSEGETWPGGEGHDRYEVASRVDGSATVDGVDVTFDGPGERDHSWGPREWVGDAEWLWISGAFEDGTAYNHLSAWIRGFPEERFVNGFWYDGDVTHPLTGASVRAEPGFGVETARDWAAGTPPDIDLSLEWAGGSATIDVDPDVTTPLEFGDGDTAAFNRSAATQRKGTVDGAGWLENIQQIRED